VFWTGSGPAETRRDVVAPAGAALWVLGIVGAVAAGVGGGLYWYGRPAPATSLSD
jgi:hypothetical protein